jgi:hypothetical protein
MCVACDWCWHPGGATRILGSKMVEAHDMFKFIPGADTT